MKLSSSRIIIQDILLLDLSKNHWPSQSGQWESTSHWAEGEESEAGDTDTSLAFFSLSSLRAWLVCCYLKGLWDPPATVKGNSPWNHQIPQAQVSIHCPQWDDPSYQFQWKFALAITSHLLPFADSWPEQPWRGNFSFMSSKRQHF